jgi:uncharacterized protein (DUF983 family)
MTAPIVVRPAQRFRWALRLRCPRCGGPGVMRTWMAMRERCPHCDLALDRGESADFWLGAYAINLVIAEGSAAVIGIIVLWATWPQSTLAMVIGASLAIGMPFLFYPFSRTLWLAWDLAFRPSEEGDDA